MGERKKAWKRYFGAILVFGIFQTVITLAFYSIEVLLALTVAEVALFLFCTVIEGIFEVEADLIQESVEEHKFQVRRTGVSTDG